MFRGRHFCCQRSSTLDGGATDLSGQYRRRRLFAGSRRRSGHCDCQTRSVRGTGHLEGRVVTDTERHELSTLIGELHYRSGSPLLRTLVHHDVQVKIASRILAASVVFVERTRVHLVRPLTVASWSGISGTRFDTRDRSGHRDFGSARPSPRQLYRSVWRIFGRQGRDIRRTSSRIASGERETLFAGHERGRLALTGTGDNRQGGHD